MTTPRLRVGRPEIPLLAIVLGLVLTTALLVKAWQTAPPTWAFVAAGVVFWVVGGWGLWRWRRRPTHIRIRGQALELVGLGWRQRIDLADVRGVTVRDRHIEGFESSARRALLVLDLRDERVAIQVTALMRRSLERAQQFAAALSAAADAQSRHEATATDPWSNATRTEGMRWVNPDVGHGSQGRVWAFIVGAVAFVLLAIFTVVYAAAGPSTWDGKRMSAQPDVASVTAGLRAAAETPAPPGASERLDVIAHTSRVSPCLGHPKWLWGSSDYSQVHTDLRVRSSLPDDLMDSRWRAPAVRSLTDRINGFQPRADTAAMVGFTGQFKGVLSVRIHTGCVRHGDDLALRAAAEEAARAVAVTMLAP